MSLWKGRILLQKKKYAEAREAFKKIISHKRYYLTARYYIGLSHYEEKSWTLAYDFLRQIAEKSKDRLAPQARFRLGEIHFIKREYAKAAVQYTKVIYLYSDSSEIYEKALYKNILCFRALKRKKEYNTYFIKLSQEFPSSKYLKELQ